MKKITLIVTTSLTLFTFSCTRESQVEMNEIQLEKNDHTVANRIMNERSSEELAGLLKNDEDFLSLINMTDIVIEMPNKENFSNNFNVNTLEEAENGDEYLASISGYDVSIIENTNLSLINSLSNLQEKYPELISTGTNREFIIETVNMAIVQNEIMGKKSCKDCAREGRAQMAAGLFLGAATGSALGPYGAWVGGVLGFWAAGEITVTCLKNAGC